MIAPKAAHPGIVNAMREAELELIELHRRLVRVPSVNRGDGAAGVEREVARVAAEYLAGAGVVARIAEDPAQGRSNLLAEIRGESAKAGRTLLLMSHSDVVPAGEPSAWRFPPFSAEMADGRIWGRGAYDCKMLAACELFVMAMLARQGLPETGRLRLAIGADEEAGGRWGFGWLAENEPDFLRTDLAINEGGGSYLGRAATGERLFTVGCGEKGRYEITLTVRGRGAHASVPWGKVNPITAISALAVALGAWEGEASTAGPIFEKLRGWLGLAGGISASNLNETLEAAERFSKSFPLALRAQSRMTIVPTIFRGGEKSNAVPAQAELRCDARTLPGQSRGDLENALKHILSDFPEVEWRIEETAAPSVSPLAPEIEQIMIRALESTFRNERWDESPCRVVPAWCTGFTDSRFARTLGTPTYGFQVVEPRANPDRLPIHCIDESIEAGMLLPCAEVLAHIAMDFLGGAA